MLKLSDVVNAFMKLEENVEVYLNKRNGTVITISSKSDSDFYADRTKNFYTEIANNNDDYILLPNCKAIGAERIMVKFVDTIDSTEIKEEFLNEIECSSCSKFMDMIYRFGLVDFWNDFKYKEMIEIAKETIKYYNLDCVDDIFGSIEEDFYIEVTRTVRKTFKVKSDSAINALAKLKELLDSTSLDEYEVIAEEKIIKH